MGSQLRPYISTSPPTQWADYWEEDSVRYSWLGEGCLDGSSRMAAGGGGADAVFKQSTGFLLCFCSLLLAIFTFGWFTSMNDGMRYEA